MLLQLGDVSPSFFDTVRLVALAAATFAVTYAVARRVLYAVVDWTFTGVESPPLVRYGTTGANALSLLVAFALAVGVVGFGSFQLFFALLSVVGLTAFAGVAYRVERALAKRQYG
ncbi:hypothetical protein AUR64_00260 [Haloprofundus marisrubri]|uniref:Uncharacterized protein n=1 Tax=Haloprofundus marisrubri TaxID=1514971 RepID=A0A0W1RED9_9EURY|nr:hypothetical protein [Haloprofundus marisrubri]KTG11659.1 hypothetical protein AUR64_00260 [Haloprofundus marisrubri]